MLDHGVVDDMLAGRDDDASSMGFSTATKSVFSNRRGILRKVNNQGNSDEDDSLDSVNTAFTNKSGATSRSVTFDLPSTVSKIEKEKRARKRACLFQRCWIHGEKSSDILFLSSSNQILLLCTSPRRL